MGHGQISTVIMEQLKKLGPHQQRRVLEFARVLVESENRGAPVSDLLALAGSISQKDAAAMNRVVDEACEQVSDEW